MNIPEKYEGIKVGRDMYELKDVEFKINAIIDYLHDIEARLPEPEAPKWWRAGLDEEYWIVDDRGGVSTSCEEGDGVDNYRYNSGNYFRTKGEAEAYRESLLAKGKQI